jgi:2-keto-4-pentenoate hydratase/2-oxohepta-3-ene-1,7-dioic acid hydratase in catechol pathway
MRIGQFVRRDEEVPWAGVVLGERVVCVPEAAFEAGLDLPWNLTGILGEWRWRAKVEMAVEYAEATGVGTYDRDTVERRAPVTDPEKVVCVGLNYAEHAEEGGGEDLPEEPVLFSKFPTSVTGPGQPIEWDPDLTSAVDYEAELVVVIGEEARDVDPADARDHVAGYTVGNDVSARDLQMGDEQWVRGKSLDTFAPVGPDVVTPDELGDPHDLDIWTDLDGERLQDSNTRHLVFDTDYLVSFCSRAFTLRPGDLLFTGTPDGVGYFRDPQVLLEDSDEVTVGVEGVGELSNPCAHR